VNIGNPYVIDSKGGGFLWKPVENIPNKSLIINDIENAHCERLVARREARMRVDLPDDPALRKRSLGLPVASAGHSGRHWRRSAPAA